MDKTANYLKVNVDNFYKLKELSKKWNRSTKSNWTMILNELIELFGERVEKYIKI